MRLFVHEARDLRLRPDLQIGRSGREQTSLVLREITLQQRSVLRRPCLTKDCAASEGIAGHSRERERGKEGKKTKLECKDKRRKKKHQKPQQDAERVSSFSFSFTINVFFLLSQPPLISLTLSPVSSLLFTSFCGHFHLLSWIPSQHRPDGGGAEGRKDGEKGNKKNKTC